MIWKEILDRNLVLLQYDSTHQLAPEWSQEKHRYSQNIILFLLQKFNNELYEELMQFVAQPNDKQTYYEYLRKLHAWCNETVSKKFVNYSSHNTIMMAAQTDKSLEELLARLTSCCLLMSAQLIAGGNTIPRSPISCLELQKNNLSSELALLILKEDFKRETRAYLELMQILNNRNEKISTEFRSLLEETESKRIAVEKLKLENFGENGELVIDENTVKKRLDESDECVDILMSKLEKFSNLCDQILEIHFQKAEVNRIGLPELKTIVIGQQNTDSLMIDDKLSINKVIKKAIEELSFDREPLKNSAEINRVSTAVQSNTKIIAKNLINISKEKDNMTKLLNNLNEIKREEVIDDETYGTIPTVKSLMDAHREDVQTEDSDNLQEEESLQDNTNMSDNLSGWDTTPPSSDSSDNDDDNQVENENVDPSNLLRTPPNKFKPKYNTISTTKRSRKSMNTSICGQSSVIKRPLSPIDFLKGSMNNSSESIDEGLRSLSSTDVFYEQNPLVDDKVLSDEQDSFDQKGETFPNFLEALTEIANSFNNESRFFDRSDDSFLKEINENE